MLAKSQHHQRGSKYRNSHSSYGSTPGNGNGNSPQDEAGTATAPEATIPSAACFPAHATVRLRGDTTIPIEQLRIGDEVEVISGTYSSVFAFAHRDTHAVGSHLRVTLASSAQLTLTPGRHVYLGDKL